jgi:hypothetical protein
MADGTSDQIPHAEEIIGIMNDIEGLYATEEDHGKIAAVRDIQTATAELCEQQQEGIKAIIKGTVRCISCQPR